MSRMRELTRFAVRSSTWHPKLFVEVVKDTIWQVWAVLFFFFWLNVIVIFVEWCIDWPTISIQWFKAVDWWGVGVLTYELLTGASPFTVEGEKNNQQEISRRILSIHPPIPEDASIEVKDFICQLLTKDPSRRLGGGPSDSEELKQHPFFKVRLIHWLGLGLGLWRFWTMLIVWLSLEFKLGWCGQENGARSFHSSHHGRTGRE